jgi:uncharacterized protein (DUF433 family)
MILDCEAVKMEERDLLERIVINPKVMTGKPVIRGTRLTVQYILGLLAHDVSIDEIIEDYQGLKREDILACLIFATKAMEDTTFVPLTVEAA